MQPMTKEAYLRFLNDKPPHRQNRKPSVPMVVHTLRQSGLQWMAKI